MSDSRQYLYLIQPVQAGVVRARPFPYRIALMANREAR
jgi:hypothetical protein